jgi:hypothetical protein
MFDARTAIVGLYLWLLFGFLSNIVSCDIKRFMNNVYFRHFIGVIAFFLLFTITDKDNDLNIGGIWIKTFFVYFIFLMMTKSKWFFSVPVLLLLIIDQSYKFEIDFIDKNKKENKKETIKYDNEIQKYENIRKYLYYAIITLIVVGFIHYTLRQYKQFGTKFSFSKLLFYSSCKN